MNYVVLKWCRDAIFFHMNAVSFSKEYCIAPLFKLICHEVIKYFVKGMPHSWKSNVYIRETLPFSEIVLPLWKTYHICSKIYGRHGALFLKECCAHLRALLHSNDTLYQRNAALSVEECCMEVWNNFLKECHILLHDDWWEACCCPYNLSW